ncbi:sulfatase-like hydrolase/transferase [Undibacterium sp. TJN19]|uniref:sulfatase-like hydrolase/transferase n=1 Tax=Undibacterium sp. TJN19 TaxID=3413055 RepID=UPI003BF3BA54
MNKDTATPRPNILFILVDQMRYAPLYPDDPLEPLYKILRFQQGDLAGNPYADLFPGFRLLREHGVSLQNHTCSSIACVPGRATIMTGQYSARSGVTQTEGMFKIDTDPAFPWLPQDGVPTMGDWFRAAGYDTHYFGRWDLSNPPAASLEQWGFADWEYSSPSDQRFGTPNLGVYRDKSYTDLINTFLRRKALGVEANIINSNNPTNASFKIRPWLAVASFVNPHDIGAYPFPWQPAVEQPGPLTTQATLQQPIVPYGAPMQGTHSQPPTYGKAPNNYTGTYRVPLNPGGFKLGEVRLPANWNADLSGKPDCQYDYSYKFQLALTTLRGQYAFIPSPYPFKMQANAEEWYRNYLAFYLYLQYLVNLEISSVLERLFESGLDKNTIVVFTSDHGELAGAHGGQIEKWCGAYQESIHVPAIISSPLVNPDKEMRVIQSHTTHVDWVPTLLGLAGFNQADREALGKFIQGHTVEPLAGEDLSPVIIGSSLQPERKGVLFVSDDNITAPLDTNYSPDRYGWYVNITERLTSPTGEPTAEQPLKASGPVVQPNHIQSYYEKPWKLVRYWDPGNVSHTQWELYNHEVDANENHNLLGWDTVTGAPLLHTRLIEELGLGLLKTEHALLHMRKELNHALLKAGYTPQNMQDLGIVAAGNPPG